MPANDQKIIEIIYSEIEATQERCNGYHNELKLAIADIIASEREHRVARTNIDQRVSDKINAIGQTLATSRSSGEIEKDR